MIQPRRSGRLAALAFWIFLGSGAGNFLRAADVQLYGKTYRPLTDVAAQFGMTVTWITPGKILRLKNQYSTLEFTLNERTLRLNGQPMSLSAQIVPSKNTLCITKTDFDYNILPLLAPAYLPSPPKLRRIIIDPGHGGKDPGGENPSLHINEKTETLDVSLRLAKLLQDRGYEVLLTRSDDHYVELNDRSAIANKAGGDLFICIHFNIVAASPSVSGIETFVITPPGQPSTDDKGATPMWNKTVWPGNRFDYWNTVAGFSMEQALCGHVVAVDRGLKRARFVVFQNLQMPGMLIECGFLTNPAEAAKINTAAYRQKIAEGIAAGVDVYKATLDHVRPQPLTPPSKPAAGVAPSVSAKTGTPSSNSASSSPARR